MIQPNNRPDDRPFSLRELQERWGVSDRHLRMLIKAGRLKVFTIGCSRRVAAAEVRRIEAGADLIEVQAA